MTSMTQRQFKGLSQDITAEDISELSSPMCQDVMVTPRGALSSPLGSTKWNTSSVGFVNGFFDYRSRVGQWVMGAYSVTGAGYPGGTTYGSGGPVIPGTVVYTSTVQNDTFGGGGPVNVSSIDLTTTGTIYNEYGGVPVSGYTINATIKDSYGSTVDWDGQLKIEKSIGSTAYMTVTNGVGSLAATFTNASPSDVTLTITASVQSGTALSPVSINRTAYYVYMSAVTIPSVMHGATSYPVGMTFASSLGTYSYTSGFTMTMAKTSSSPAPLGFTVASGTITGGIYSSTVSMVPPGAITTSGETVGLIVGPFGGTKVLDVTGVGDFPITTFST